MGNNYIFSLTPTFTQGLVLGQLSILVLLALVLKYLFFVSPESEKETGPFHPLSNTNPSWHQDAEEDDTENAQENESAHWFNILARQVVDVYRAKLQNNLTGYEGIEVARRTIEDHANEMRPRGFLDHITVHSVDLGMSAPKLSNARVVNDNRDSSLTVRFHALLAQNSFTRSDRRLNLTCHIRTPFPSHCLRPICSTTRCLRLLGYLYHSRYLYLSSSQKLPWFHHPLHQQPLF